MPRRPEFVIAGRDTEALLSLATELDVPDRAFALESCSASFGDVGCVEGFLLSELFEKVPPSESMCRPGTAQRRGVQCR